MLLPLLGHSCDGCHSQRLPNHQSCLCEGRSTKPSYVSLPPPARRSPLPAGVLTIGRKVDTEAQDLDRKKDDPTNHWQEPTRPGHLTQYSVDVFGQRYALHVDQYAANLWIAVGEFLGHQLRTIERTAQKAVRAWQKAAIEKQLFGDGRLTA